jgi:hypothetical protein
MKRVSFYSALLLCLVAPLPAFADGKGTKVETIGPAPVTKPFGGLSMGVGLSLTHDLGWNDRITRATLDANKIVRVEEERNDLARIMLELHYFFTPNVSFLNVSPHAWGHGPFVAIEPGKENIINAIGAGWMIGFRNSTYNWRTGVTTYDTTSSWNFGVGFVVENSKILGDGIRANQPLPAGEAAIRYKDTSQGGVMFITSFSF